LRPQLVKQPGYGHWTVESAPCQATHRAITIDLRGHGRSDWPGEYSVSLMPDDVGAVLDGLGLRDVARVGHSLGGEVAFDVAARRPDLVSVLVDEDFATPQPQPARVMPTRPDSELPFVWDALVAIRTEMDDPGLRLWDEPFGRVHAPWSAALARG
jgi:3-oxoadipate enol-lactonase